MQRCLFSLPDGDLRLVWESSQSTKMGKPFKSKVDWWEDSTLGILLGIRGMESKIWGAWHEMQMPCPDVVVAVRAFLGKVTGVLRLRLVVAASSIRM